MRKSYARILGMLMALVLLLTLLPTVAFATDDAVPIDETNFPDAAFREYVAETLDSDHNGTLSPEELDAVTEMDVSKKNIFNLTGIGFFQSLKKLDCSQNELTALDVNNNPLLAELHCNDNKIAALDVSKNSALTVLSCATNCLTALDVANNPLLADLHCAENKIATLDVSKNPALVNLNCMNNQMNTLNTGDNPVLRELFCRYNRLTSLDISKNPAMRNLYCSHNLLLSLDVSHNSALVHLECGNNRLTSMDISNTALTSLSCSDNQREIELTAGRTFDLSKLPGFDITKASDWDGGTVKGTTLAFNANSDTVIYSYDCGNGQMAAFKLVDDAPFIDVKKGSWYEGDVRFVYENGLMAGTSNKKFSPQTTTTRGMLVSILYRLEGQPEAGIREDYSDVEYNRYYALPIAWSTEYGIVSGYGNGKFGPNDSVTREQLAAILYRYASFKQYNLSASADLSKFADSNKVSDYAQTALRWATGAGLLYGKNNNMLDPKGNATRAEVAAILHRFCDKIAK